MVNNMISRAAVLLAAFAATASAGKAIIQNSCSFPVYLSSVSNTAGATQELAANGGTYSEEWRTNPDGGGISIKMASDSGFSSVTQFEYTLSDPDLWYDLSNINGYPFQQWGVSIIPSDSSCTEVICPAGVALCASAYNTPTEDWATAMCYDSSDMVVMLCSGADSTSDVSPTSSIVAATSTLATSTSVKASSTSVKATSSALATSTKVTSVATSSVAPVSTSTPVSTVTSAATVTSSSSDNGVVIQTTFVTQVVTVVGGSSDSSTTEAATTTTDARASNTWTGRPHWTGFARRHEHHAHRHGAQQ